MNARVCSIIRSSDAADQPPAQTQHLCLLSDPAGDSFVYVLMFWYDHPNHYNAYSNPRETIFLFNFMQGLFAFLLIPILSSSAINLEFERQSGTCCVPPISIPPVFSSPSSSPRFWCLVSCPRSDTVLRHHSTGGSGPREIFFLSHHSGRHCVDRSDGLALLHPVQKDRTGNHGDLYAACFTFSPSFW